MNPFIRLFWKEVRTLRAFWIVLLVSGAVLLYTIAVLAESGNGNLPGILRAASIVMTFCFLGGAVALSFAAEEEHGTANWLRLLPTRPVILFLAKSTAAFSGGLLLLLGLLTIAMQGLMLNSRPIPIAFRDLFDFHTGEAAFCFAMFATTFSAGLLHSQLTRKVFLALLGTGTTVALAAIVGGLIQRELELTGMLNLDRETGAYSEILMVLSAVLFAMTGFVTGAWQRGRLPFRWRYFASDRAGSRTSVGQNSIYHWSLRRCASAGSVFRRTVAVLLWRELRFAVPFFLLATIVGIAVSFLQRGVSSSSPLLEDLTRVAALSVLITAALEAGLRTFRHDKKRQHGMFWSHRGVAPGLVWLCRQSVWITGILLMYGIVLLTTYFFHHAGYAAPLVALMRVLADAWYVSGTMAILSTGLVLVGVYSIGQLLSAWLRSQIIAAVASVSLTFGFAVWILYLTAYDIPLWLTVLPMTVFVLICTFGTRLQWMDGRQSVRVWVGRASLLLAAGLSTLVIQSLWRVYQIPDSTAFTTGWNFEKHGWAKTFDSEPFQKAWNEFYVSVQHIPPPSLGRPPVVTKLDGRNRSLAALDEILNALPQSWSHLPSNLRVPWLQPNFLADKATAVLLAEATELAKDDKPAVALQRAMHAVHVNAFLIREASTPLGWSRTMECQSLALQVLREISSDNGLSADQLGEAIQELADAPNDFQSILDNRWQIAKQLLVRQGYVWTKYQKTAYSGPVPESGIWYSELLNLPINERMRIAKILGLTLDKTYGGEGESENATLEQLSRWAATTRGWPLHEDLQLCDGTFDLIIERLKRERQATMLVLGLQRYRRMHGKFPRDPGEIKIGGDESNTNVLHLPDSDIRFGYASGGLGYAVFLQTPSGESLLIHPDQPIVWNPTTGMLKPPADAGSASPANPDRVYFIE